MFVDPLVAIYILSPLFAPYIVQAGIDKILTENAFLTYLARYRSNYDILLNTGDTERFNAAKYGINHAVATLVLTLEKGVMDLRKYRL
jgi:hypothetical protein